MKIFVAVKRVVDYNVKVHVLPDHSGLNTASAKMSMNPFDEIAVEQAVRLKEAGQASEVVVVSIGATKVLETLRVALAMGADRAVHVLTQESPDALAVAKILAAVAREETPDLILMGKQAIDNDDAQVPQMLSALLDMPVATCANKITLEGTRCTVACEVDSGVLVVQADCPMVVSADLRLAEPRYVTLPSMMKARKKPVQTIEASTLAVPLTSTITQVEVNEPAGRSAGVQLADVDELIDTLKNVAKVL